MGGWKRRDRSPLGYTQRLKNGKKGGNRTRVIIEKLAPVIPENQEHDTVCGNQLESNNLEQYPHLQPIAMKKAMRNDA